MQNKVITLITLITPNDPGSLGNNPGRRCSQVNFFWYVRAETTHGLTNRTSSHGTTAISGGAVQTVFLDVLDHVLVKTLQVAACNALSNPNRRKRRRVGYFPELTTGIA